MYFTGYADINSRKFEDQILTDEDVKSLLVAKFNYFIAYVDDNAKDKAPNLTVGQKNGKIQVGYFKKNYQPYLCIIDEEGKVLSEINGNCKKEEFIMFLKKGIE